MTESNVEHVPVLAETLGQYVTLEGDGVMVDCTVGQGGHSSIFSKKLTTEGTIIGIDFDKNSLNSAHSKLKNLNCKVKLIKSNFADIKNCLKIAEIEKVDFILADLGFCSAQLDDKKIGLSFSEDAPLDMRIDKSLKVTAADIINGFDETKIADIIYKYGEDRASRRIAKFIVNYRRQQKIMTTTQLAMIVCKALGRRPVSRSASGKKRIHPATKTFQALRIAVNGELDNLTALLNSAPDVLRTGGQIAVISFHSLEDRIVKYDFKENKADGKYEIITKKPLIPSRQEMILNRRSRSAKLRIAKRI